MNNGDKLYPAISESKKLKAEIKQKDEVIRQLKELVRLIEKKEKAGLIPNECGLYKDVLDAAKNFTRVRKINGYDDKAHKSAGWYLAQAVSRLGKK